MGLLYTQALADRATAYLALPLNDKRSAVGLLELASIWAAINKLPPVECRQCQYAERQADVAAYVRNFSRLQNPETMSDSQYQFAPAYQNESISDERYAKKVTADNLTDEDAEFLIPKGYGHVIVSRKAAEAVSETPAGDADSDEAEPTEREQEQLAKYEQVLTQLETEQSAHATTTASLEAEKQQYETLLSKYNDANASRVKSENSLKSEKTAHGETKKQLAEVQKQLAEAVAKANVVPATDAASTESTPA